MYLYLEASDDGLPMRTAGPWAAVKLDYLRRYIDAFETSMRTRWAERNYIDLMAGPGKNRVRRTGEILLGSPLLALTTRHPFTGYHFVDLKQGHIQALTTRCAASPLMSRVTLHSGDCNVVVDEVLHRLRPSAGCSLNLAFLDPQGLELRWETVAKLASMPRMDLIINYPEGGLNRAMRTALDQPVEMAVDRFFGDSRWRDLYRTWSAGPRRGLHRQLIDLYRAKLRDLGYGEVRSPEPATPEPLLRNVARNAPLYRVLFASKHPLGERFWREVTRRDIYGQSRLLETPA